MKVRFVIRSLIVFLTLLLPLLSKGAMTIGEWTPLFKGIELSISTNVPDTGSEIPRLQVVYAVRVDLHDPDVKFFTTPRIETNYIETVREVAAYTPTDFLVRNDLQLVINANFFSEGTYYLPPATPMDVYGLAVSEGTIVSLYRGGFARSIVFDATNGPTFVPLGSPSMSLDGIHTAISGNNLILTNGIIAQPSIIDLDPRTVYGLSQDRRYLYLVAFDGRQTGYSVGATLRDCGIWMLALGAYDAINLDGGGSTTIVMETSTGQPLRINKPNSVADSGRERTVGSHFGIWAKPVPGFFNDVVAQPGINSATISFTTTLPTRPEIRYGTTSENLAAGPTAPNDATTHSLTLTGLTPETGYYFQLSALSNGVPQLSPLYFLTTTNQTTTNLLFDITNSWSYAIGPFEDTAWTATNFNESAWASGPGLLWVETRSNPPAEVEPKNTPMPGNPDNFGTPYMTYYFRTHFNFGELTPGSSLLFQGRIDDGAVFYLNGTEFYRLRMPTNSTSTTRATSFPCSGDATCVDEFKLPLSAIPSLQEGDNVIAVEVHNYNPNSGDITFGLALNRIDSITQQPTPAELNATLSGNSLQITWEGAGGMLQSATDPAGPWNDLQSYSGNSVTIQITGEHQFFRLVR